MGGSGITEYQREAVRRVNEHAKKTLPVCRDNVERFCASAGVDALSLIEAIRHRPITVNFHPDRFSNNGLTIISNLIRQGQYHSQYMTGTSNGGRTAYRGGDRDIWEKRIFFDTYPPGAKNRPVYGALNIFGYLDGASMRFGSCFFTLKDEVVVRCTYAYGDSSSTPKTLCTFESFWGIADEILREYTQKGIILNRVFTHFTEPEVLSALLFFDHVPKNMGRNLNNCIEVHVHGDVMLGDDVESLYIDESYRNTDIEVQACTLCERYKITLQWIPERRLPIHHIDALFRGPKLGELARLIDEKFGHKGYIDAELIGRGSRDSVCRPEAWSRIGNETELFQYFKQLWHTVGYFGS